MRKFTAVAGRLLVMTAVIVISILFPGFSLKSALLLSFGFGTSFSLWRLSMV